MKHGIFYYSLDDVRECFRPFLELIPESIYAISPDADASAEAYVGRIDIHLDYDNSFKFYTFPANRQIFMSTKILDLVWITAYSMGILYHEVVSIQDPEKETATIDVTQPHIKTAINMLFSVYGSMANNSALEWGEDWPMPNLDTGDRNIELANDLMLGALAFMFHHEIAHINQSSNYLGVQREQEADMKAAEWIFRDLGLSETAIAKQGLSVVSALIVLNSCGIILNWWGGITHPFVYDRLIMIIERFFKNSPNSQVWSFPSVVITTTLALAKRQDYIFHPCDRDINHRDFLIEQVNLLRKLYNDMHPPYIYLDSMVFRYLRKPRTDKYAKSDNELMNLISQNYYACQWPFSEAHCIDLTKNFSSETAALVYSDLDFINSISSFYQIGINDPCDDYAIFHNSAISFFDEVRHDRIDTPQLFFPWYICDDREVDLSQIPKNHFLYDLLVEAKGKLNHAILLEYLEKKTHGFFADSSEYIKFKESLKLSQEWIENNAAQHSPLLANYFKSLLPIFDIFSCSTEECLLQHLPMIIDKHLALSGKYWKDLCHGQQIELLYMLLDFNPIFSEKLNKKNIPLNMTRDCKHFIYAHMAKYYITEDEAAREKARFVAKYLGYNVKVLSIEEFVTNYEHNKFLSSLK